MTTHADRLAAPYQFEDGFARALWEARENGRSVPPETLSGVTLSRERGKAIALELAHAARAAGAKQIGWKIGASDRKTRLRLGTAKPFVAPIFSSTLLEDGAALSLERLVAPKLEIEIAAHVEDERVLVAACIEIIDCRFRGRDISIGEAIADFGLHAYLLLGQPQANVGPRITATVSRGQEPVVRVSRSLERATSTLRFLTAEQLHAAKSGRLVVATGSLAEPLSLTRGSWGVDFGPLGRLRLMVEE